MTSHKCKKVNQGQPRRTVNLQLNYQFRVTLGVAWHRLGRQGSRQNVLGRVRIVMAIGLKKARLAIRISQRYGLKAWRIRGILPLALEVKYIKLDAFCMY